MLTLNDIWVLPKEQLPGLLQAYALLPVCVIEPTCPPGVLWIKTSEGYASWEPQTSIAHAWPFVETWGLTIAPSGYADGSGWWVAQEGSEWYVDTFAEIPAAICRVALSLEHTRRATLLGGEAPDEP